MSKQAAIVVFRLGSLGDTVMALPLFHRIAQLHPQSRRVLLTNIPVAANAAPAAAVLGESGLIHDYIAYPLGLRSPAKLLELRRGIIELNASTLYYLQECHSPSRAIRDYLFFRFCGISKVVGAPILSALRRPPTDLPDGEQEAECERLARNLATLAPIDLKSAESWDLRLNAAEREIGRAAVAPLGERPIIAINTGGKVAKNDWGQANWRALVASLADRFESFGLLSVGAAQDAERASDIGTLWRGPFVDLSGKLSPRQSAAALECATLFVGHDSGPIHLASAVGVSCVGLYGDHNPPRAWHPYFGEHRIIHDMRGVAHITVEEVDRAVEAFLGVGRKAS